MQLILDIHTTDEIAGNDVEGGNSRIGGIVGTIANATDEASAFYLHIDRRGHYEFNAATKGVDIDFLVLSDDCLAQIHADAAAESVETGTVKGLAMIDVLVAAIVH